MEGGIDWLTLALGDTQCPTIKKQVRSLLPCGSGELSIPNPTPSLTSSSASLPSSTLAQLPQFEGPGAFFVGSTRVKSAELRTDGRESRV